jgi:glycerophosphoryl diester phosphodiesterase
MNSKFDELKQTASQLLAAMLSNPHIYPQISDEGGEGKMEQQLITIAVEMAKSLIQQVENTQPPG